MIKDLVNIANRLDNLGLTKEADHLDSIIYKIARKYVETVIHEGLSGGFFAVVNEIQEDIFDWIPTLTSYVKPKIKTIYPNAEDILINQYISSCYYNRGEKYSESIGASDPGINPWIFSFLNDFILPFINISFRKAIEKLPADYSTKSELKQLLSLPLVDQQGVNSMAELLDGGGESYLMCIQNIIHEIHHNIINHSAWRRFQELGSSESNYSLLDALDEGIADSFLNIYNSSNTEDAYKQFASGVSYFMLPILENIILGSSKDNGYFVPVGSVFLNNWEKIYDHLKAALKDNSGIQSKDYKISFIEEVLKDLRSSISAQSTLNDIKQYLTDSVLSVWNNNISKDKDLMWDFLVNDDEDLLINLMKDLDDRSAELSSAWKSYKRKYIEKDSNFILDCIELNNYFN